MRNALIFLGCGLLVIFLAVWTNGARAEGNEPTMQVTLCFQPPGVDIEPLQALRSCGQNYQKLCPGGYDLGQIIVNVTSKPYWVAAELTCKPGTRT